MPLDNERVEFRVREESVSLSTTRATLSSVGPGRGVHAGMTCVVADGGEFRRVADDKNQNRRMCAGPFRILATACFMCADIKTPRGPNELV